MDKLFIYIGIGIIILVIFYTAKTVTNIQTINTQIKDMLEETYTCEE